MATWTTPKTDWTSTDSFNIEDYNRIRGNLEYLCELAQSLASFTIEDMGDDYVVGTDESNYWLVSVFNAIEDNLDTINENTFDYDFGSKTTFYENGLFIKYSECNRIESACLTLYNAIDAHVATIPRLGFTLGQYRAIRC